MRLVRKPGAGSGKRGAGSGEQGKRERGVGIVIRNPKKDKFHQKQKFFSDVNLKKSNFSETWDLLPWIQKSLLPSKIEESTCDKEGELKIKLEKERMQGTERKTENLKKNNLKTGEKKQKLEREEQRGKGRGGVRERENLNQENGRGRRRVREREIFKKKYEEGEEQ
jgi:hypothetical protein